MLTRRALLRSAPVILLASPTPLRAGEGGGLEGVWTGAAAVQTITLKVRFVVAADASLAATNIATGNAKGKRRKAAPPSAKSSCAASAQMTHSQGTR